MESKECTGCHQTKILEDFAKDRHGKDGHATRCKGCKNIARAAYKNTPEGAKAMREAIQRFKASPKGRAAYLRDLRRDCKKEAQKRYNQTQNGKDHKHLHSKTYRLKMEQDPNYRLMLQAEWTAYRAVRKGVLPHVRTCLCLDCGKPAFCYHHHLGYAKEHWLDVIPLCYTCHSNRHHPIT